MCERPVRSERTWHHRQEGRRVTLLSLRLLFTSPPRPRFPYFTLSKPLPHLQVVSVCEAAVQWFRTQGCEVELAAPDMADLDSFHGASVGEMWEEVWGAKTCWKVWRGFEVEAALLGMRHMGSNFLEAVRTSVGEFTCAQTLWASPGRT